MPRVMARRVVAVVALVVAVAAIAWVSVPFHDHSVNCGAPIALHSVTVPNVTSAGGGTVNLCKGPARERVAVSAVAIVIVGGAWLVTRRRWGDPPL